MEYMINQVGYNRIKNITCFAKYTFSSTLRSASGCNLELSLPPCHLKRKIKP